jgi:hypothetical protein
VYVRTYAVLIQYEVRRPPGGAARAPHQPASMHWLRHWLLGGGGGLCCCIRVSAGPPRPYAVYAAAAAAALAPARPGGCCSRMGSAPGKHEHGVGKQEVTTDPAQLLREEARSWLDKVLVPEEKVRSGALAALAAMVKQDEDGAAAAEQHVGYSGAVAAIAAAGAVRVLALYLEAERQAGSTSAKRCTAPPLASEGEAMPAAAAAAAAAGSTTTVFMLLASVAGFMPGEAAAEFEEAGLVEVLAAALCHAEGRSDEQMTMIASSLANLTSAVPSSVAQVCSMPAGLLPACWMCPANSSGVLLRSRWAELCLRNVRGYV